MTILKGKKRMMYVVFALIFACGGIEYAVILPTLLLYLQKVYNAPEYMLGFVLSAYSLGAFFTAPIIGRISDRIGCTKQIFIVCAIFEFTGSFLYFIEISQWLCLGSRFVSGMGAASEAVALAEVAKYTTEKERTSFISYLVVMRQIALLIGPGFNAFLRLANFKIGPFEVNKYSAPGAFMVVMWTLLILIVLIIYTEPRKIFACEMEQQCLIGDRSELEGSTGENIESRGQAEPHVSFQDSHIHTNNMKREADILEQSNNSEYETTAKQPFRASDPFHHTQDYPSDSDKFDRAEFVQSCDEGPFVFPPISYHTTGTPEEEVGTVSGHGGISAVSDVQCDSVNVSGEFYDVQQPPDPDFENSHCTTSVHHNGHLYYSGQMSSSMDLLISAERIINESQYSKAQKENDCCSCSSDLVFNDDHFGICNEGCCNSISSEKSPLQRKNQRINLSSSQLSLMRSYGTNGSYIERSTSCLDDPIAIEGKLGFFCNEYIRDEIVTIVCLLFCGMFSQVCLETMVLPVSLKYLDFDELENSLLYCFCGIELVIAFLLVSWFSRRFSDRVMIVFGTVMLLAANIWLICFLPIAPLHNRVHNIPIFAVTVFLSILSLPFIVVCATSLFSKLTRKQTQGLSQGLRRGVIGLGTVMAPLWGSSTVNEPYLQIGVLIGLQGLSLILCALSYKKLEVPQPPAAPLAAQTSQATGSVARVLSSSSLVAPPSSSNYYPRGQHGSIQISGAGSSYNSFGKSAE